MMPPRQQLIHLLRLQWGENKQSALPLWTGNYVEGWEFWVFPRLGASELISDEKMMEEDLKETGKVGWDFPVQHPGASAHHSSHL